MIVTISLISLDEVTYCVLSPGIFLCEKTNHNVNQPKSMSE